MRLHNTNPGVWEDQDAYKKTFIFLHRLLCVLNIFQERRQSSEKERKYSIVHTRQIVMHDSISFLRSCESLSFLVRDVVHITPENFHTCVAAIRTFVEASYKGELTNNKTELNVRNRVTGRATPKSNVKKTPQNKNPPIRRIRSEPRNMDYDADEEEEEDDLLGEYTHVTMQLLDLMHVLHTRAAGVHEAWAAEGGGCGEGDLWDTAWCPVLQGMARLCCDRRAAVRTQALTLLQRSLLIPDLQVLRPNQWEFCFLRVLFPMLRKLLEPVSGPGSLSVSGKEETKLRAAMMLSKVFLQHLGPLSSLPTFTALWLTILDFLAQFITTAKTDLLADALPESLKNMLLVMDTSGSGLFFSEETGESTSLWVVTWEKIDTFLPNLKQEIFKEIEARQQDKRTAMLAANKVVQLPQQGLTESRSVTSDSAELDAEEKTLSGDSKIDVAPTVVEEAEVHTDVPCEDGVAGIATLDSATDISGVSAGISSYFSSSVISNQPVRLADPIVGGRDRFPSLPVNLNQQERI